MPALPNIPDPLRREYEQLFARREELRGLIDARLKGGVKSASLSTAGNSQSYTALDLAEIRAEIRALTARLLQLYRQINGGPSAPFCGMKTSVPCFGP